MHVQLPARAARGLTVAVVALLTLGACSKEKRESGGDVTPGAAAPAPTASTVAVADIDLGRSVSNSRIADKTNDFKPTDTIYTSVHTTGTAPSTTKSKSLDATLL